MDEYLRQPFATNLPLVAFSSTALLLGLSDDAVFKAPFPFNIPTQFYKQLIDENIASIGSLKNESVRRLKKSLIQVLYTLYWYLSKAFSWNVWT